MSKRGWAVFTVLLVGSIAGCQSVSEGGVGAPTGAEGKPAGGEGTSAGAVQVVPVVYDATSPPEPLTPEQWERILKVAKEHCPKGRSIWFLWVHSNNRAYDGRVQHWTSVYYSPEKQTARLRRGSCLPTGGWVPAREQPPIRSEYCQVSLPSEAFGDKLSAPQGLLLPFPAPEGFSDDEIVDVVDFVRSLWSRGKTADDGSRVYSDEKVSEGGTVTGTRIRFGRGDSILSMTRDGEVVTISVGSCQGPLAALYTVIRCVKSEGGYKVIDAFGGCS